MIFPDRYINRAWARQAYGPMADHYASFYNVADPLADALVEKFSEMLPGQGHRMLLQALEHGVATVDNAPSELVALFEHVDRIPSWVDFAKINVGARTYQRTGVASMMVLSAWSLMNGYHSAPAVKPLAFTKQLDAMAPRRLAETGRFVTETIQVDGMRRFNEGFKIAVRVRVMHAMVRQMLRRSGSWHSDSWGAPINQCDMAGTVIEFSALMLRGTRMMGYRFTKKEAEGIVHLWRYSGYLSGVDEELLQYFDNEQNMQNLAELIYDIQPGPDQDSLNLAAALRSVGRQQAGSFAENLYAEFFTHYHDGLTWAFNKYHIARDLEIPNEAWKIAIYPTKIMIGGLERLRELVPGATQLASLIGNRLVRNQINDMLENKEPTFVPKKANGQGTLTQKKLIAIQEQEIRREAA